MKTSIQFSIFFLLLIIACSCSKQELSRQTINTGNDDIKIRKPKTPNIIVILADDIGYEIPTYTGGQSYSTPNIDFLAANGTQFTQAHTAPLCSPSRFMLLTGKYNFRNYTTWGVMDTSNRTIANLANSAGYATCMAGKWQCDGGGASIGALGFQKYLVTNPYEYNYADSGALKFYKDPQIFENGAYWPASKTKGKYGDDIIRDYMFNFIDSLKNKKPFFIYWATNLVHQPYCPTPDDPEFASWNSNKAQKPGDSVFFPSMVKYEDKLVGQLLQKLQNDGIANNTIIIWLGDNGTDGDVHSLWNGQVVSGSKSSSTEAGTHVPMVAYCPGKVLPGATDTSLISLVDFMPSIADITNKKVPLPWGAMDGINFTPQLSGNYGMVRPWIFCHFIGAGVNETDPFFLRRWMQDDTYKQYDSLPNSFTKKFYNIRVDPLQEHPILPKNMTAQEKAISQQYLNNMKQLH